MQTPSPPPEASPDVFDEAVSEVRERIRSDAALFDGDDEAAAFVEHLADHLFDADLDVGSWRRSTGVSRAVLDRVVARLGPLKPYIDELRIAVASRLVLETAADVSAVGRRVGFPVTRTFRRTFARLRGKGPQELREARDAGSPPEPGPPQDAGAPATGEPASEDEAAAEPARAADPAPRLRAARWRRRFALGLFDRAQAAELRGLLRRRYPDLDEEEGGGETPLPAWVRRPVRIVSLEDSIGWLAARVLVVRALAMPDPEMRRAFVHGIRFGQLTGYYLLHEVSVGLLERDIPKAVAVAELAVEMVAAHRERQADENADWRALAWAGLGQVRLLAGDRASADAAFVAARAEWETPREKRSPVVEAQICRYESALRTVQRRFEEAAGLLDRAVEQTRSGEGELHAVCRVERAELARIAGDAATAVEMLREVLGSPSPMRDRSDGRPDAELFRCMALSHLVKAHLAAGAYDQAAARLDEARATFRAAGVTRRRRSSLFEAELDQLEARLFLQTGRLEEAESRMRAACDGFEKTGGTLVRAAASAELAAILAHRGRRREARAVVEELSAFFARLPLHREALHAARLLGAMCDAEEVPPSRIDELSRCLEFVVREAKSLPWRKPRSLEDDASEEREETRT